MKYTYDDEEQKIRYERAKQLSSGINTDNYSSNFNNIALYNLQGSTDEEKEYISRFQKARELSNSINPRQNVEAPSVSEDEKLKSIENTKSFLDLMDNNSSLIQTDELLENNEQQKSKSNKLIVSERKNANKNKAEIDKQIQNAKIQTVSRTNNLNNQTLNDDIKIGLANQPKNESLHELSTSDIKAMKEAQERNKEIEKGGADTVNAYISTILKNIQGGLMKAPQGLVNVVTTLGALGIKGLEGASSILGLEDIANNLNNTYNSIVDIGSDIKETADYESTVTSQLDNEFVRTSGQVADVGANMVGNFAIGYVTGIPSTKVQGLSVGGSSSQEVLDEKNDNVVQASITGLAKGYVSHLTEKMFDANILTRGQSSSISNAVDRMIINKLKSKLGKEVANYTVNVVGENIEELVEDNVDNLIDKFINNKETPEFFSKEWLDSTSETAKVTTLSTIVMSLLGLGGDTFENKEKDMQANYWIEQAQQIIDQEDMAIHFNPNIQKNINDVEEFYITKFNPDGDISGIVPTKGKVINNANNNLNITPVIIKDSQTDYYNIIDGNTGVVLDSTYYDTTLEAENSFTNKVNNLSDLQIKDINNKISESKYLITNKIMNIVNQAQEQLMSKENNKSKNIISTKEELDKFKNDIKQISDKSIHSQNYATNVMKAVSNKVENVELVRQNGMTFVNSLDKDGRVAHQQKISSNVYTGAKIKQMVNEAINHADMSNIDSSQTSTNQNTDTLQSSQTSYTPEKVKTITEPFNQQQEYTKEEMAEVWNNEIDSKDLQNIYDDKGNSQGYVSIEQDGDNLIVKNYDDNDNVIASEVIRAKKNGKYSSRAITNAINKVTGVNAKVQKNQTNNVDTEQIANLSDNEISDIVRYNPDGREITDQDYVDFMVKRYKDNKNISGVETDTEYVDMLLDETYKEASDLKSTEREIINKQKDLMLNKLILKIREKSFKKQIKLKDKQSNYIDVLLDIQISKKGLKESFNKSISNEKYAVVPYLDELIKSSETGIIREESKLRDNIDEWYYLYNTAKVNGELYAVKIDIKKTQQGDRFYVHRLNIIKEGNSRSESIVEDNTIKNTDNPSTNTSIPQKDTKVKSVTDINKSMQEAEKYTPDKTSSVKNVQQDTNIPMENLQKSTVNSTKSVKNEKSSSADDNVGSMKQSTNKLAKSGNIKYNDKGIKLGKKEYVGVVSAINTDNPNLSNGIHYKFYNDNFYMFQKKDFGNYNFIAKTLIGNNEQLINKIRKEIDNGTIGRPEEINSIVKNFRTSRRRHNNDNISSKRARENGEIDRLHNRNVGQKSQTRQRQNSNTSSRNQSGGLRGRGELITDNQGRQLSKQQQEFFKNSKVRDEKGNLLTVYHGTSHDFNTFKYSFSGEHASMLGKGFYFTADKMIASRYLENTGKPHIKEVYLNIQKPITLDSKLITRNEYIKFVQAMKNEYEDIYQENYEESIDDIISRYDDYYDEGLINYVNEKIDLVNDETSFKILRDVTGIDGLIDINPYLDGDGIQYVAFNSDQIKNVDNVNPTSDSDIRYMKTNNSQSNQNVKNNNVVFKNTYRSNNTNNFKGKTKLNAEREGAYIEQEIKKVTANESWDDTIPVTKLTDIRKTIEDYLGLGIKKGHFRQHAYAIYKGNRDVIRTKEYKDIDSILHETGHALDIGNRLKVDKESIADELLTAIDKLGGYEKETRSVRLEEGFAEVIREYSIIPKQAKVDYPQTVAVLEKLRQSDKSFDKFITKVQQQTYNYIHQNPQKRDHSNQSIGQQTDKTPLSKERIKQQAMTMIWDDNYALKSAVNTLQKANGKTVNQLNASDNAYLLTRLMSGIGDKVSSMLADGYIDENGNKLMPGLNKIGEILGNDASRFNDLRDYLVAKRDTEYKKKRLKTGIRTFDSNYVIEKFKNDSQIQEAARIIYDTLDGVMQYAVNNGLISQETATKLKESNAFYVPMQRVVENTIGNQIGTKGAVKDIIKRRTGSELDIKDVLENIIANSTNIIRQVENNNALKALYRQGEASGLTGVIYDVIDTPMTKIGTAKLNIWKNELESQGIDTTELDLEKSIDLFAPDNKIDRQHLITSFIDDNGDKVYLQFNDKMMFNSLMGLDKDSMGYLLKLSNYMNQPLKFGATMGYIGFSIPNMISDTAQAAIFSTAGFIPVVDNAIGVLDILAVKNKTVRNFLNQVAPRYADKINNLYTIYQQTGATSATRLSQYRKSTQNIMKDIYGTKKSENLDIKESFKPLKRLLDIMTYIPELSEQSTRFRVFQRNYDYYKNKGNSEMDARILAAMESRDATQDFGRTGSVTREINQLLPFSAARVGSVYTFAEKVTSNPKQVTTKIALLMVIAMGIRALGYDDDEIEELNQRKKDDNFVFKIGDNIVTIKKPQGILRSMINLTEYIQDLATGHIEEGKEGERLSEWVMNSFKDNLPADNPLAAVGSIPFVGGLAENIANKDFYYNTDIVKSYDLELPDSQQYYEYNSQLAIGLGQIFNYSPAKIDNLFSSYFGGLGTQVTNAMDYAMGKMGMTAEKPEMGAESDAVGKRFIVNVNSNSASVDEIYNRKTELTKKKNGETITDEEAEELETITNAVSDMSKLNKQIKEIKKDLSMSGKEKADKIKLLQQQRTDIARQALGKSLIHPENEQKIQSTQFYPTNSSLSKNNYELQLTSEMKEEYEQIASEYYSKYESQGIYNEEKLKDIKSKAKEYAKNQLFKKYKSELVKTKK